MKPPTESTGTVTAIQTQMVPLKKIKPSPTNPRKRFDAEAQQEMEASMRQHGFTLSTLLLRPWPASYRIDPVQEDQFFVMEKPHSGGEEHALGMYTTLAEAQKYLAEAEGCYEIVAGERRYRAALAANIGEAPSIIRDLSDREVVEQQLVENLQRKDLTAMETALGFAALISMRDADGKPVHTTKTIHEKTGMSVRFVERHLRLKVIAEEKDLAEFRKAFEEGVVGFKHALHVARLPEPKLRLKLANEILKPQYEEAPLSVRKTEALVQRDYMVDLRDAPFELKDETLKGKVTNAAGELLYGGSCKDCPLRLGNSPEMFDGVVPPALANMCMNPSCYDQKREMAWAKWQQEETDPKKKRKALSEKECRQIYAYGDQLAYSCGYVDLSQRPDSSDLKPGQESPGTWRAITKGRELEVLVVKDRNGKTHELVKQDLAVQAADLNGHKCFKEQKTAKQSEQDRLKEAEKDNLEREIQKAELRALSIAVYNSALTSKAAPVGFWPAIFDILQEDYAVQDAMWIVEERHEIAEGQLSEALKKMPEERQFAVIAELVSEVKAGEQLSKFLKIFEVNEKAVRKDASAKAKAEQKKRSEIREEILALAKKSNLSEKQLDKMSEGFNGDEFADLRDVEALEQILKSLKSAALVGKKPVDEPAEDRRVKAAKGPAKK